MVRQFFSLGVVFALVGVAAGAFGAHVLRDKLSREMQEIFETAVRYQMYHALALLVTAWAASRWPGPWVLAAGWLFVIGILIFSGSLAVLALSGQRWWGAVTPLGGLAFLAGWICLLLSTVRDGSAL